MNQEFIFDYIPDNPDGIHGVLFEFSVGITNYSGAKIIIPLNYYLEFKLSWISSEQNENFTVTLDGIKTIDSTSGELISSAVADKKFDFIVSRQGEFLRFCDESSDAFSKRSSFTDDSLGENTAIELHTKTQESLKSQVKSIWDGFIGYRTASADSPLGVIQKTEGPGTCYNIPCHEIELHLECPGQSLLLSIKDSLKDMALLIDSLDDDDDKNSDSNFLESLEVNRAGWTEEKTCQLESETCRPFSMNVKKNSVVEFLVNHEAQFQVTYTLQRFIFLWDEIIDIIDIPAEFSDFYDHCTKEYDYYSEIYPVISRIMEDGIHTIFESYDRDKSGFIDTSELQSIFHDLYGNPVYKEAVEKLMKDFDINRNGKIEWTEFRAYILRQIECTQDKHLTAFSILEKMQKQVIASHLVKFAKRFFKGNNTSYWFVLDRCDATLVYYDKEKATIPRNVIPLLNYVVAKPLESCKFILTGDGTNHRDDILLVAPTTRIRNLWVKEINRTIDAQNYPINQNAVCYGNFVAAAIASITGLLAVDPNNV